MRAVVVCVVLLSLARGSSSAICNDDYKIIWPWSHRSEPVFIPLPVLLSRSDDPRVAHAVLTRARAELRRKVELRRGAQADCDQAIIGGTSGDVNEIVSRVRNAEISFVGTVRGITTGWYLDGQYVSSLARLELTEEFADRSDHATPGDVFTVLLQSGDAVIDGVRLCTETSDEPYVPRPGDPVLFIGIADPYNVQHLSGAIYRIDRDRVVISAPGHTVVPLELVRR